MIARFTGGILGTLAFSVSILTGLWARNPVNLILSRAVWALCVFSVIGLLVGGAAQRVVNDYARRRREELVSDGAAHRQEPVSADPMNPAGTPEETPAG